jgi:hypothetical protein
MALSTPRFFWRGIRDDEAIAVVADAVGPVADKGMISEGYFR